MPRTRGASERFHQDDGVVLGKGGVPIPAVASMRVGDGRVPLDRQGQPISPAVAFLAPSRDMDATEVVKGPGAQPEAPQAAVTGYRAEAATWGRQMTAWELARLLDMAFRNPGKLGGGFVVEITPEEYQQLNGDLRQHFMPVRAA